MESNSDIEIKTVEQYSLDECKIEVIMYDIEGNVICLYIENET